MKPSLACDFDESKLKFPLIASPKMDGVRCINIDGVATGRSLKPFKNSFVTERYSGGQFVGFDGELALGNPRSASLCRDTSGLVARKTPAEGKPVESDELVWRVFDDLSNPELPYEKRQVALAKRVRAYIKSTEL